LLQRTAHYPLDVYTPYNTLQTALQAPLSIFTLSKDISLRQEIFTAWKKYSMIDDTLSIL